MSAPSPLVKATDSVDLAPLIERLEKATGPDRELDKDIYVLTTGGDPSEHRINWQYAQFLPRFTESLDAAVTLVSGQKDFVLASQRDHQFAQTVFYASVDESQVHYAANPAIALCLAALRNREASR